MMPPIRFQLLTHDIAIHVDDAGIRQALAYLALDANHAAPPRLALNYIVLPAAGGGFDISENGSRIAAGIAPDAVMPLLYSACHKAAHDALPPHLRLHAGCATLGSKRILFVGRKGAGKTSLMLRLAFDDTEVQTDERMLIFADGQTLPYPRRFHVRPGSLDLLPELAAHHHRLPVAQTPEGGRLYAFAPSDIGRRWRIEPGPVDALVFLKGSHGAASRIEPLGLEPAMRRLHRQTTFPVRNSEWFTVLLRVASCADSYLLYNGDLNASATILRQTFTAAPH